MWKKTINTIKKNPRMLWGFIIPVIVGLALVFPVYKSIVLTLLGDYSRIDDVPNFREVVRSYAIASPFIYMLMGVFVLPPLYAYIYKACTGKVKKMWTRENFVKYSWRVVVKSILGFITLFALFIVLFLFFAVPSLGFTIYTFAFSAWGVFWIISLTSVTVEDRFIDSLPNTFFIGVRYYFKMYATSALVMMPAILVSTVIMVYLHNVGMNIAYAVPTINMEPKLLAVLFILFITVLSIYYVFAQSFLFTYSMHHYINEKEKLEKEDIQKQIHKKVSNDIESDDGIAI